MSITVAIVVMTQAAIGWARATETTPELRAVLRSAKEERLLTDWIEVTQVKLGAVSPGANTFSARVRNLTTEPQLVGLDLRAMPGLWFRNWQKQFSLLVPPRTARRFEVQYQWPGLGASARLRVRFARATRTPDGELQLAAPALERTYQVGVGNPAAAHPRVRTENFDIYVEKGSLAESEAEAIGRLREAALQEIEKLLGVSARERIVLAFYSNAEVKTRATGHIGAGLARDGMIVEIYNAETRLDPFHELAHVVGRLLGDPPALLNEGFAVYASERLGSLPLRELGHPNRTIDQAVCDLSMANELLPLDQLFGYTEIGSEASRWRVSYAQAASVVKYLIETTGLERFRQLYAQLHRGGEPPDVELNRQVFERIVGLSVPALERGWRQALPCQGGK